MASERIRNPGTAGIPRHPAGHAGHDGAPASRTSPRRSSRSRWAFPASWWRTGRRRPSTRWANCSASTARLQVFLDSCVKCGACTDKCHYFLGTSDPKNMPVARQDLLRKVYRRYFTFAGKYFPKLVGAVDLTKEVLDDWYSYFHQCSQCRRCSVFCPYGIDTAEISMAAREIMDSIGVRPEVLQRDHRQGLQDRQQPGPARHRASQTRSKASRKTSKMTPASRSSFRSTSRAAEILLVTPSADFFAEPHVDGLIGYGKVFHEAGVSWTAQLEGVRGGQLRHVHRSLREHAAHLVAHPRSGARSRRQAHRVRRMRPRLARRLQLPEHPGRPLRLPRSALSGAAAHLRVHLRSDPAGQAAVRQVEERRPHASPSTTPATSRAPRAWATCRAVSS